MSNTIDYYIINRQELKSTLFPYTTLFRSWKNRRNATLNRIVDLNARALRSTIRSEEHTSELQSPYDIVCRLLLEKKKNLRKKEKKVAIESQKPPATKEKPNTDPAPKPAPI